MLDMSRRVILQLAVVFLVFSGPVQAGDVEDLTQTLRIDEVIEVLRDECLLFGADLERDMLDNNGGPVWRSQLAAIYDTDRMTTAIRAALEAGLSEQQIARSRTFFATELGQRILSLETSARQAMADPEVEQIARDMYLELAQADDDRLATITRFIEVNDLVEYNVVGALNASYYFMRGLVDGGTSEMSEAEIIAEVWSQEQETRTDTQEWLYGFLLLAYRPLSDSELASYISYSETQAGQALNTALFAGFDRMYLDISHALGVLVAQSSVTKDL